MALGRRVRGAFGLGVGVLTLAASCGRGEGAPPRVVLLVVQDTLAAAHVSHLGYPRKTTPHLDRLARDGVAFSQAVTPATYTLSSIPSLLTGRLPDRHGVLLYQHRLPEEERTLAELLGEAGYRTVAICCVVNGSSRYGNDQGFDEFHEVYRGPGPEGATRLEKGGETMHLPRADEVPPLVERTLDRLGPDERLFLYIHFLEPHTPYQPPVEFISPFADELCPQPYRDGDRDRIRDYLKRHGPQPWVISHLTRLYDANILWSDANLGRVIDMLRERGLYESALVVSTADHGEALFEHGYTGHGHELFEEELRVPLVIKLPGRAAPRGVICERLVSTIDVVPTLADLLRRPAPPVLDGHSLAGLLRGEEPLDPQPGRRVLVRTVESRHTFGWRLPHEKQLFRFPGGDLSASEVEAVRYDLVRDPHERTPLSGEAFPTAEQERLRLVEVLLEARRGSPARAQELTAGELDLLERLGYTDTR